MRKRRGNTITERCMGNIPVGVKYDVVGIEYNGKYGGMVYTTCENCGRAITNIYIIQSENDPKKTYQVGSECVKPLVGESPYLDEYKRLLASKIRFIKMMNTKAKSITPHNYKDSKDKDFRVYGFVTKEWDVRGLGKGDYNAMKMYIDMLDIPITDCGND